MKNQQSGKKRELLLDSRKGTGDSAKVGDGVELRKEGGNGKHQNKDET